ncbi:hypothetical protein MMC30_001882 [Trapelia coarctata]|nr:hypothetical protein [Trapelia coarctata]
MKTCALRLASGEDKDFGGLAKKTVRKIMGYNDLEDFPFGRLPLEIQTRVMELSGIVQRQSLHICSAVFGHHDPAAVRNAIQPVFASLSCEALRSFYFHNRFTFLGCPHKNLQMVKQIPIGSIQLIQHVHYHLGRTIQDCFSADNWDPLRQKQWDAFVYFIRDNFILRRLTLVIGLGDLSGADDTLDLDKDSYKAILAPLRELRGLKRVRLRRFGNLTLEKLKKIKKEMESPA